MSENIQVKQLKPVYPAEEHENVRALLDYAARTYGDDTAFILKEKSAGRKAAPVYRNISYKDLREDVRRLGTGMMAAGISHAIAGAGFRIMVDGGRSDPLEIVTDRNGAFTLDELEKGVVTLRDMDNSTQKEIAIDKIEEEIHR